jgi:CRISPR/Cas system-associated endoribonuclease Cas2
MAYPDTIPIGADPAELALRYPLIILCTVTIICGLHISFQFIKNYFRSNDTVKGNKMHAAWASLFFGYSTLSMSFVASDFFSTDLHQRDVFLQIGYLCLTTGAFLFIYYSEKLKIINTRRIFTIVFTLLYVVLCGLIVTSQVVYFGGDVAGFESIMDFTQYSTYSFFVPVVALFLTYCVRINRILPLKLKKFAILMAVSLFAFTIGFLATTDSVIRNLGIGVYSYFLGVLIQICALGVLAYTFLKLPSWRELEWREAIRSIFVIYRGGMMLFNYDFKESDEKARKMNPLLVAGALEMAKSVLTGMMQTETVKVLDLQDKKVIFEQGDKVMVSLITDQYYESLAMLTHEFVVQFERFFASVLPSWQGDVDVFAPTKALVSKIFDIQLPARA